jgi:hypothetical protein
MKKPPMRILLDDQKSALVLEITEEEGQFLNDVLYALALGNEALQEAVDVIIEKNKANYKGLKQLLGKDFKVYLAKKYTQARSFKKGGRIDSIGNKGE